MNSTDHIGRGDVLVFDYINGTVEWRDRNGMQAP